MISIYTSHFISTKLAAWLLKSGYIDEPDIKNYIYCFDYVLEYLFFLTFIFLFCIIFDITVFGLVFFCTFAVFRHTCGGFHADSRIKCTVFSVLFFIAAYLAYLLFSYMIPYQSVWIALYIFSALILFLKTDVATIRSFSERKLSRLLSAKRLFIFIYSVVYIILCISQRSTLCNIITICIFAAAINAVSGHFEIHIKGRSNQS